MLLKRVCYLEGGGHVWTRIHILAFDQSVVESFGTEARFNNIIQRILSLHQGPLKIFTVEVPPFNPELLDSDSWFTSLIKTKINVIEILNGRKFVGGPYLSIPSCFYNGGLKRWTYICFEYCSLRPPPNFKGFPRLIKLELIHVHTTSIQLADLIASCPRLEILHLIDMLGFIFEPLIIKAGKLRILLVEDYISGMVILKDTSRLTAVTIECSGDETEKVLHKKASTMYELLCSMSAVEELAVDLSLLEPLNGCCPNHFKKEFVALKTLTLGRVNICNPDELLFILSLLRSSPNLKTLNISLQLTDDNNGVNCAHVERRLQEEISKGFKLCQLLNLKVPGITRSRCEIMFLNTMLSSCPLLKTLRNENKRWKLDGSPVALRFVKNK